MNRMDEFRVAVDPVTGEIHGGPRRLHWGRAMPKAVRAVGALVVVVALVLVGMALAGF